MTSLSQSEFLALAEDESQVAFIKEAVQFLSAHGEQKATDSAVVWGVGDEGLALFEESTPGQEREAVRVARDWQRIRWEAGFGWIDGPTEHGGRGLSQQFRQLYRVVEAAFDVPDAGPLRIGLGTVSPPIVIHGNSEQIATYGAGIHRGDLIACQLFSEPDAGSDLAGLRTRGVRMGDGWVIDGQKVWTSNAQFADIGLALVRTNSEVPKHEGITAFLIPMDAKGVTVRPLRQMTGGASFNEVFLEGVVVPDAQRLGGVGAGWTVAQDTLSAERGDTGDRSHQMMSRAVELLWQIAERSSRSSDSRIRDEWVQIYSHVAAARFRQMMPESIAGGMGRVVDKLLLVDNLRRIGELARELLGTSLVVDEGEWGTFEWNRFVMGALGYRIAGGTDEVLRGVLASRALKMPSER